MDPEAFLEMANQVTKLKMFPYFDVAHCALCCLYVREDLGTGEDANPFECVWFCGSLDLPVDLERKNRTARYNSSCDNSPRSIYKPVPIVRKLSKHFLYKNAVQPFFLFGYVLYNNNLPYGSQSLNCGDVSFVPVPSSGAYSPRPNNQLFLEAEVMSFSCDARGGNGCIYFLVLFSLFALRYKMLLFRSEAHTR